MDQNSQPVNQPVLPATVNPEPVSQALQAPQEPQKPVGKVGRPTVLSDDVVGELIGAFQLGMNDTKACQIAMISRDTFYTHLSRNKEFSDKIARAKNNWVIKAGYNLQEALEDTSAANFNIRVGLSKWIYEKHMPEIYGNAKIEKQNNQQNNIYVLESQQISNITKQPDIDKTSPAELLETLETASKLDNGAEEGSIASVHPEEVQSDNPNTSDMPQPSSTV